MNTPDSTRKGDWIQTYTGRQFWPLDARCEEIVIEDIAHALGNICRFAGHSRMFYSVAQHSVLVSRIVPAEFALWGLLHDAGEAYLGDVVTPLKSLDFMTPYREAEDILMKVVCERFGLSHRRPKCVWEADRIALATEHRDLMPMRPQKWADLPEPLPERIDPCLPAVGAAMFLARYEQILQASRET